MDSEQISVCLFLLIQIAAQASVWNIQIEGSVALTLNVNSSKVVVLCLAWMRNDNVLNNHVFFQEELPVGNLEFIGTYRISMSENGESILRRLATYSKLNVSLWWF